MKTISENSAVSDRESDSDHTLNLPENRVIRKRIAASTIGVHMGALPPELQVFINTCNNNTYLRKYDLPEEVQLAVSADNTVTLSRNEAWKIADKAGEKLEWDILPDNLAGKATAHFSSTGQGVYANYGRPSLDFSGFFHDYIKTSRQYSAGASNSLNSLMLGPLFITIDTISAAGFTALGHITRGAPLTDKTVVSDIVSTGVFEGSTAWASAKLGILTGSKAMRFAAMLPIPGAQFAAIPTGFLVGAATAIFAKHFTNQYKNYAIDARQNVEACSTGLPENSAPAST